MSRLFFLFILSFFSAFAYSETSVWKAVKENTTVYLGGTIHMLRPQDYPLPKEFEKAYQAAKIITFETDISQLTTPKIQRLLIDKLSYQDNRTIQSVLSESTYNKLNQFAAKRGLSLNFYRKAKPGMVMMAFLAMEMKKLGITGEGIDKHFFKKAKSDHKQIDFLETPNEQIEFLSRMGENNEEKFYLKLMQDFSQMENMFEKMIAYWREGNSQPLNQLVNESMAKDYPKMFQFLLIDRNNRWMPEVEGYFSTKEVEFVMVGAAHLIGKHGLIEQLKAKGYQVSKLQ